MHDQAKVRCVATVGDYRVESNFDMISVLKKPTTTTTTTTTTPRTSTARPSSSTVGERVRSAEVSTDDGVTSATPEEVETDSANLEVAKAGPRGIILSIIGKFLFLSFREFKSHEVCNQ